MSHADTGEGTGGDPGTVDRRPVQSARCQDERGRTHRDALNAVSTDGDSLVAAAQQAPTTVPATPFTLVIEIDGWNLLERGGWGQNAALKQAGPPPSDWHGVYGATVFGLDHRGQAAGGRHVIRERAYGMTRGGVERLRALS